MFGPTQKIFTVYEKPEAAEPADRMLLLRDGFSYWAFVFGIFWLLMHRMWRVAALFFAAQVAIAFAGEVLGFSIEIDADVKLEGEEPEDDIIEEMEKILNQE